MVIVIGPSCNHQAICIQAYMISLGTEVLLLPGPSAWETGLHLRLDHYTLSPSPLTIACEVLKPVFLLGEWENGKLLGSAGLKSLPLMRPTDLCFLSQLKSFSLFPEALQDT